MRKAAYCIYSLLLLAARCVCDDGILGLNGFVKESAELQKYKKKGKNDIDLSQVKVELYTTAGVRKYEAECTPNGYYFIAVYDTGSFVAKAKGPGGWSMSPAKIPVECTASGCAGGKDVNFEVTGFSVKGKIEGAAVEGCSETLSKLNSVTVTLKSADGKGTPSTVKANSDGSYTFNKVLPGDYVITANHPTWTLGGPKKGILVTVKWGAAQVQEVFTIKGYQLTGSVKWKDQPVGDVDIAMFSDSPLNIDCQKPPKEYVIPEGLGSPVCFTKTDAEGGFKFDGVACGKYTLVPRYSTSVTEFQVSPQSLPVSVGHGNAQLGSAFAVTGFSIGGKVVHSKTGVGVEGVTVLMNGKKAGVTDAKGGYSLGQMEDGSYSIEASLESHKIEKLENIEVNPRMGELPDMLISQYTLCGSLSLDSTHFSLQQTIQLTLADGSSLKTTSDSKGEFCFWAPPGEHSVQVLISDKDKAKGLVLGPRQRMVVVEDAPVLDAIFVEKRVSLTAVVKKLDEEAGWGDISLQLAGQDFAAVTVTLGGKGTVKFVEKSKNELTATFQELVPSSYTLKVSREGWCWHEDSMVVSLDDQDKIADPLQQKGFVSQVFLSHAAQLRFDGPGASDEMSKEYTGGRAHSVCLSDQGKHTVTPSGCLTFDKGVYSLDPSTGDILNIKATHFHTTGSIRVDAPEVPEDPVAVEIVNTKSGKIQVVPATKSSQGVLSFPVSGALKDVLKITPSHSTLLFHPPSMNLTNTGKGCQPEMKPFASKAGLFLTTSIEPPVEGVSVVLKGTEGKLLGEGETDADGSIQFGPLHDDQQYSIAVEKTGFEFEQAPGTDSSTFIFKANQLAKVEVQIDIPGDDKQGVLVVLTGGDRYRSNGKTDADGIVTFWDLPPSDYYIKPVLKEYDFEPSLKEVTVEDGKDAFVTFKAKRTAFSVMGVIKGFANKGMGGVTVEAVGPEELYENTVSNEDGSYRIRGLKSNMPYSVKVVPVDGVERGWPEVTQVTLKEEPMHGVDFTVFLTPELRRVTGVINMDPDLCNKTSVKIVKVTKDGSKTKVIEEETLDFSRWFDFAVGPGNYVIQPSLTALQAKYTCKYEDTLVTVGKQSSGEIHIGEISVDCTERHHEGESEKANRWPVIAAILAVVAMQFRDKIQGFFSRS